MAAEKSMEQQIADMIADIIKQEYKDYAGNFSILKRTHERLRKEMGNAGFLRHLQEIIKRNRNIGI